MRETKIKSLFSLVAGCLIWPAVGAATLAWSAVGARAQTSNTTSFHVLLFIRDSSCNVKDPSAGVLTLSSPGDTLIFESRKCNPVLAPDGTTQLTLSEFLAADGSATAQCVTGGTKSILHLTGLVPNGVYTVWHLKVVNAPGTITLAGIGSLGPNDGSGNVFTADANGNGTLTTTSPAGPLSLFGSIKSCWLSGVFDNHLVVAYHIDGKTSGKTPGPGGTFVEQFAIVFEHH